MTEQVNELVFGGSKIFLGKIAVYFINLLFLAFLTRSLGPDNFGAFNLSFLIVNWFATFALFGMDTTATKFVAEHKDKKSVISSIIILTALISIPFAALNFLFADFMGSTVFHNIALIDLIKLYSIYIPISTISILMWNVLRGLKSINVYTIYLILKTVMISAISVGLIIMGLGVFGAIWGYTLGALLSVLLVLIYLKRYLQLKFDTRLIKLMLIFGFPFLITAIVSALSSSLDRFLLGIFTDTTNVGLYSAAFSLISILLMLPAAFSNMLLPMVAESYRKNMKNVVRYLNISLKLNMVLLGFALLFTTIFSNSIMEIIFGADYAVSSNALIILVISTIFAGISTILIKFLAGVSRIRIIPISVVVSLIASILFNVLLIPVFGINGAAVATVLVWIVNSLILSLYAKSRFEGVAFKPVLIILMLTLLLSFFEFIYNYGFIAFLIAAAIYLFAVLKIMTPNERQYLRTILPL